MKRVTVGEVPAAEGRLTEQRQVSARREALISSARQINMVQVRVDNRLTGVLIPKAHNLLEVKCFIGQAQDQPDGGNKK